MNKKGFTLIEVILSIVLVSVVLTSMLATLVKLRENYSIVNENTDALIYSSSVSRILNNDLSKNGGIRYVNCNVEGDSCNIILANNQRRRITIITNEISPFVTTGLNQNNESVSISGIYCDSTPKCKIKNGTCERNEEGQIIYYCPIKNITTTLKYEDMTDVVDQNQDGKLIYLKSLTLTKNNDAQKDRIYTVGYIFGKMSFDSYEYESTNKFVDPINKISPFRNRISTINIEINDMIDQNDSTYSITLYSASSFAPGMNVGDEIKLVFDADYGIENDINNITVPNDELVVKYGVGYYVYNITEEGKTNILKEVNKIQVPTAVSKNGYSYTFDGYYYEYNRDGTTEEVQIVDENGNIIATNTYFIIYQDVVDGNIITIKDRTLYAKWH